jgi:hypothetical protein
MLGETLLLLEINQHLNNWMIGYFGITIAPGRREVFGLPRLIETAQGAKRNAQNKRSEISTLNEWTFRQTESRAVSGKSTDTPEDNPVNKRRRGTPI